MDFLSLNKDVRHIIYKYLDDMDIYSMKHVCTKVWEDLKKKSIVFSFNVENNSDSDLVYQKWLLSSLSDSTKCYFAKKYLNHPCPQLNIPFFIDKLQSSTLEYVKFYICLLSLTDDKQTNFIFLRALISHFGNNHIHFMELFNYFIENTASYHNSLFYRNLYIDFVLKHYLHFKDKECLDLLVESYGPPRRFPWSFHVSITLERERPIFHTFYLPWCINFPYISNRPWWMNFPNEFEKYHWISKTNTEFIGTTCLVAGSVILLGACLLKDYFRS